MSKIEEILSHYDKNDYEIVKDTIEELCKNGVGNGCYQDYSVLVDVIEVLVCFEEAVKNEKNNI